MRNTAVTKNSKEQTVTVESLKKKMGAANGKKVLFFTIYFMFEHKLHVVFFSLIIFTLNV